MIETKPSLYLLRHGESEQNRRKNLDSDSGLTETGIVQAIEAGRKLRSMLGQSPAAIIHSGLTRTYTTAQYIKAAGAFECKIAQMNQFRERHMGSYNGSFDQLLRDYPELNSYYLKHGQSCIWYLPGNEQIEALDSMLLRVQRGLSLIEENYPNHNVVLVSHAGPIKIIEWLSQHEQRINLPGYLTSYVPGNCLINPLTRPVIDNNMVSLLETGA